jgi:formylglycine-generating enzyme required for sulfatase activity
MPNILLYKWHNNSGEDEFGFWIEFTYKQAVQRMRWIKPGRFLMGSPENEPERGSDEIQHEVIVTEGFWLADTACTQELWQVVMGTNPSRFKGANRPVENMGWENCGDFLEKINRLVPDISLRLPTEAQWEYACRSGTTTPFSFGNSINPGLVNYNGEYPYSDGKKGLYRKQTVKVKSLPPNRWGLYEMHGNVWEWCADWYDDYPDSCVSDPVGPAEGSYHVLRGGSWIGDGGNCRSADRSLYDSGHRYGRTGFRFSREHQTHGVQTSEQAPDSPERKPAGVAERNIRFLTKG